MKRPVIFLLLMLGLAALYLLGPEPDKPVYRESLPAAPVPAAEIPNYLARTEPLAKLRSGNEAMLVWALDTPVKTPFVFLYLHGFSASRMEGYPLHRDVAKRYGGNLYLSRLAGHGFKHHQLEGFTAEKAWESAQEALVLAQQLGHKVIIISTSTGGTLALRLAATYPDQVEALINLSPNIAIRNSAARILNDPWGLQVAKLIYGGDYREVHHKQKAAGLYWDTLYTAESTVQLEELLETTMLDSIFESIHIPVLNVCYYKNENEQDEVVDVQAIRDMHHKLGTPDSLKRLVELSTPGDHVIGSAIKSKDVQRVEQAVYRFMDEILKMKPVENPQ